MNQSELIELSKAAAKVVGIDSWRHTADAEYWLHEDTARCMEALNKYPQYRIDSYMCFIRVTIYFEGCCYIGSALLAVYDGDRNLTRRVTILKALVAWGERK